MDKITVYTDGSALSNGRPGSGCGWACKLIYKGQARMKSGGAIGETNNRMEMQAVLEAMKSITNKTIPVEVYSDSNYVVETMNGHFAMKKNRDLWRKLMRERQRFTSIRFIWVKGHDKNQHNNDVDYLLRDKELQRRCLQWERPELPGREKLYCNHNGVLQGYFTGFTQREIFQTHA